MSRNNDRIRNRMNECWDCQERRPVPGNCHISCKNPDPDMKGTEQGIK